MQLTFLYFPLCSQLLDNVLGVGLVGGGRGLVCSLVVGSVVLLSAQGQQCLGCFHDHVLIVVVIVNHLILLRSLFVSCRGAHVQWGCIKRTSKILIDFALTMKDIFVLT